jgi:ribosomal protein L4
MGGWGVETGARLLVVTAAASATVLKSCRNLPTVKLAPVNTLGTYDVIAADTVVFTRSAFEALRQRAVTDAAVSADAGGAAVAVEPGSADQ